MAETLSRTCHLCGKATQNRVWYATVKEEKKRRGPRSTARVYACPACFFEKLDDEERERYRREALGGLFTSAPA